MIKKTLQTTQKNEPPRIQTELGAIIFNTVVIEDLVKSLMPGIPGVKQVEVRHLIGKTQEVGKVKISTKEMTEKIDLYISVCVSGHTPVKQVAIQIQERLHHQIPKILGIEVMNIIITIDKIVFDE